MSKVVEFIAKFEGCNLRSYLCPANVLTIGYGSTGEDIYPGMEITLEEAKARLFKDILLVEDQLETTLFGVKLTENEYVALTSLVFNIGITQFKKSTLCKMLKSGTDRLICANEFDRWNKIKGVESKGLTKRREAEKMLFLSSL